jgi:hypothetical protein
VIIRLRARLFLASGILIAAIGTARSQPVAKPGLDALLRQLHHAEWTDRAEAYENLCSDPKLLGDRRVQKELLNLLGRETGYIPPKPGDPKPDAIPDEQDEAFGEYIGQLGNTVGSFADWNDPHQACLLVHQDYDPESRFAAELVAHGKMALPCLMKRFDSNINGSNSGLVRAEVAPVVVQILARTSGLDQRTTQAAKGLILKALSDPEEADRINTIEALGNFGEEDMIPALRRIARADPAAPAPNGDSIRKWATEAIAKIEKRARR